jgi:hypothetical protein
MELSPFGYISYCTNIHAGEHWEEVFAKLKQYIPRIKTEVSPDKSFGIGLRLSDIASKELLEGNNLTEFENWMAETDTYVFTMNGFPFGSFHNTVVKDQVHAPDWSTQARLDYTKRLFLILARILPQGMSGGVSTNPVGYRHWFKGESESEGVLEKGAGQMLEVALYLHQLEKETGKYLHLDIEPEPDGFLENTPEVLDFFKEYLLRLGKPKFQNELGVSAEEAERLIKRHLTLCYDICHFALAYESPEYTLGTLKRAGIQVGKVQVSAALRILFDTEPDKVWQVLEAFDESTYLHQVTQQTHDGVKTYADLPDLLAHKGDFRELRAHFHVPIFLERYGLLQSTQDQIKAVVAYAKTHAVSEHWEVETYTWDVLPADLKTEMGACIIRELQWLKSEFES